MLLSEVLVFFVLFIDHFDSFLQISQNKVPVPKYTITHQGRLDMADFFTNIDSEIHPMRPQNLVVKIDLPKLVNIIYI